MRRLGMPIRSQPELTVAEAVIEASAMNYAPPSCDGNVALFQAGRRPGVVDHRAGWEGLARGNFAAHDIPGNHEDFIQPPNVGQLAALLEASLEVARERRRQTDMAL
jgi:thioesterase domain-containing protein